MDRSALAMAGVALSLAVLGCGPGEGGPSSPGAPEPITKKGADASYPVASDASSDATYDESTEATMDAQGQDSGSPSPADASGDGSDDAAPFACSATASPGQMVSVPAGDFAMGCAAGDTQCRSDELPAHQVTLSAFEIDKTEVTQAQYTACVQAGQCAPPSCAWDCGQAEHPAACIDWTQAKAFCAWAGKRLPTEAEWEKAARGTDGRIYPWGNDAPDCTHLNMAGCSGFTDAVGAHPAGDSPYGAQDMEGNVVEMVADWYDATYYSSSPSVEPTGPSTGTRYVGRGGGYRSTAVWQRGSSRDWYDLTDEGAPLGFRCAR